MHSSITYCSYNLSWNEWSRFSRPLLFPLSMEIDCSLFPVICTRMSPIQSIAHYSRLSSLLFGCSNELLSSRIYPVFPTGLKELFSINQNLLITWEIFSDEKMFILDIFLESLKFLLLLMIWYIPNVWNSPNFGKSLWLVQCKESI